MKDTQMPTELSIKVSHYNDAAIVSLNGRLTIESSPGLRDCLLTMLRSGSLHSLKVDLAGVPYMDASGIATLIEALKTSRSHNVELRLSGLQDRVRYLLEVAGLLPLFQRSDSQSTVAAVTI